MTADELAAIRERDASPDVLHHRCKAWGDRRALLAEVDRLRERVAALEEAALDAALADRATGRAGEGEPK